MPSWVASFLFAVLLATSPFVLILKIMLRLPRAVALSHRQWPIHVNYSVIAAITVYLTVFIRNTYYVRAINPTGVLMQFIIAAIAYIFGLVLILRQFCGVYPEYIVTTGRSGVSIRKTAYSNIIDVREVSRRSGEARLRVITSHGLDLRFTLPTHSVPMFYDRLKPQS